MVHAMNDLATPTRGAATEGGRRPTGVAAPRGPHSDLPPVATALPALPAATSRPNPEVTQKPQRRRFTIAYKLGILKQADACSGHGQIGALLRREGLFSSCLANWRLQREQGRLGTPVRKKRGKTSTTDNGTYIATNNRAEDTRLLQLENENARLTFRLKQAELILDIQKKVSEMLGIPLKHLTNDGSDS